MRERARDGPVAGAFAACLLEVSGAIRCPLAEKHLQQRIGSGSDWCRDAPGCLYKLPDLWTRPGPVRKAKKSLRQASHAVTNRAQAGAGCNIFYPEGFLRSKDGDANERAKTDEHNLAVDAQGGF